MTQRCSPLIQRGVVLVSSLLLLVVVTILALSMFRSFGIQEKIAGNVREKHRALNSAESAEQYAEWWLASNATNSTISASVPCNAGPAQSAALGQVQICNNTIQQITSSSVISAPWQAGGGSVGTFVTPSDGQISMNITTTSGLDTYYYAPTFYIYDIGTSAGQGEVYQIDAAGFGGSADAVAVVESTFQVYNSSKCLDIHC